MFHNKKPSSIKETIYTIPVLESTQKQGCAFCNMLAQLEESFAESLMGSSVAYMQDDIREQTDKVGFCQKHYKNLYDKRNRLGLALVLHTHMQKINASFEGNFLENQFDSCYICQSIKNPFRYYTSTFFELFSNNQLEDIFKEPLCIEHLNYSMLYAKKNLSKKNFNSYQRAVTDIQKPAFKQLEADLEHFIKKFDYRFTDLPWENSKDAIERTIKTFCPGFEPNEEVSQGEI